MAIRNISRGLRFLLLAVFLVPWLDSAHGATPKVSAIPGFWIDNVLPVLSDFDGDHKLDSARLFSNGELKTISITLGDSSRHSFSFNSNVADPGTLIARDIDEDGDADLLWISRSAGKFVAWLGDGRGRFVIGSLAERDFARVQALLADSAEESVEEQNIPDHSAIMPGLSFVARRQSSEELCAHRALPIAIEIEPACSPFLATPNLRGPPSTTF